MIHLYIITLGHDIDSVQILKQKVKEKCRLLFFEHRKKRIYIFFFCIKNIELKVHGRFVWFWFQSCHFSWRGVKWVTSNNVMSCCW